MIKKIQIIIILFTASFFCNAQTAYYDAADLSIYLETVSGKKKFKTDDASTTEICQILGTYYPYYVGRNTSELLKAVSDQNPILKEYIDLGKISKKELQVAFNEKSVSGLMGMNVTNLADGIAKFLVKRAKQELFISIIEKLNDTTKFPEIPILFPNTKLLMDSFNTWQYANVTNTLRESFENDMKNILENLPKMAELKSKDYQDENVKARISKIEDFFKLPQATLYISAMSVGDGIIKGRKVPDIIHTISGEGYLISMQGADNNFINSIKLIDILSYSVRSNQNGKNYISPNDFSSLTPDQVKLFTSLVYAQLKSQDVKIKDQPVTDKIDSVRKYISTILLQAQSLDTAMENLSQAKKKGEKDFSSYWNAIFESSASFFRSTADLTLISNTYPIPSNLVKVIDYSTKTLAAAHNIAAKNYSAVVVDIVTIIGKEEKTQDFRKFVVKYGSFAANVIQAQNAEDFSNALDAFALPVGSYTIKQRSQLNISLNGYIGYAVDLNGGASHGVYAPIGFALSWGHSSKKNQGAFSLFASFLDVGNIVAYNIDNDQTDYLKQEIRLESILSPSLQVFYEIGGTPITVGGGYRRTPKLFYGNDNTFVAVQPKDAFNISVLIDIPILTLYNKPFEGM